jgi:PAS domain S-box-containing protein
MYKLTSWFRNLKVSEKLGLISIFFIMPDSVMLYLFITGINANLQFASLEKMGNSYQRPLEVLLELIPEHEFLAERALADGTGASVELTQKETEIDTAFKQLEAVDARIGKDLQFTDEGLAKRGRGHFRAHLVRQDWVDLKSTLGTLDRAELAEKHLVLVNDVRTMITHAGDMSNLILDPDLDSYYLMDTTLLALPQTQDRLATVMHYGAQAIAAGELTPTARQHLAIHAQLLRESDLDRIASSVQTALNEDVNFYGISPSLQRRLPPLLNDYVHSANFFINLTSHIEQSETNTISAEDYVQAGRQARRASFRLWSVASEEVDHLLDTRMEWYKARRMKSLMVTACALLAAVSFVTFITKSISGPLTQQAADLRGANMALQAEILERKRAEADLRRSEAQLANAQKIAGIGSWEWDLLTNDLTWSEENFRIYGFEPHTFQPSYQAILGLIHPNDRGSSDAQFQHAIRDRKNFSFEQKIVGHDGAERTLHQRGDVLLNEEGRAVRVVGTAQDVTARKRHEEQLRCANEELLTASRQAGMAEVATGVLHNVGNVLNSVNVSTMIISDRLRKSKIAHLARAASLLQEHQQDLAAFFTDDPKGKALPKFIHSVVERVGVEHAEMLKEVEGLTKNIGHIKDIVAVQQNFSKVSGVVETLPAPILVEDALHMIAASIERHGIEITTEFQEAPPVRVDKHKVLQILVNLVRNAKQATVENARGERNVKVAVSYPGQDRVKITVQDNGMGIPKENLARIFAHGFTTKQDGHGFGLHTSALAATEMGGALSAQSDGLGRGALFTLELPVDLQNRN